jgi:hypothetical protein
MRDWNAKQVLLGEGVVGGELNREVRRRLEYVLYILE